MRTAWSRGTTPGSWATSRSRRWSLRARPPRRTPRADARRPSRRSRRTSWLPPGVKENIADRVQLESAQVGDFLAFKRAKQHVVGDDTGRIAAEKLGDNHGLPDDTLLARWD